MHPLRPCPHPHRRPSPPPSSSQPLLPHCCMLRLVLITHSKPFAVLRRRLEGQTLWYVEGPLNVGQADDPFLRQHVHCICICDPGE